ncbi:UDP-N-acetyl-D-glucosamine 6-dehydrogenase [hydrothermal vent metagenome]|uniref:UDP-N-acetyl-D-glucosamine 6-dehydrogenase n=1 Tax=hydrothermal vent metagenome TaxID=652676 RepID=A0A3B1B2C3_9ZZZZ
MAGNRLLQSVYLRATEKMLDPNKIKIGIIGLGYVGLPLAVEFGKQLPTVGLDSDSARIKELQEGKDSTLEVAPEELQQASQLSFTDRPEAASDCNTYIVTVPTPIDEFKRPDLTPLIEASQTLSKLIKPGDVAIFESTVYPGATEEICVPILEAGSGLKFNQDFFVGYSPERINPGDKEHRVTNILKITSGSTPEAADYIDALYRRVITVGTHKTSSIQVAEAAKVIENTQRDVNIALINELAIIFHRLGIDTEEVLKAAGTKWNFLPFHPGLVGGHCIGVDPYYLTHKAQAVGYNPEVILAGRRINDEMGAYITGRVIKLMIKRGIPVKGSKILILGLSFKENCPDMRNTKAVDILAELNEYEANVDIYDPWVNATEAEDEYNIQLTTELQSGHYDAVILAVSHHEFVTMGSKKIRALCKPSSVLFDVKSILPATDVDGRL